MRTDPGQVDVGVVADHVTRAHGPQQPAVAEVGVEPALLDEVVEDSPRGRDQLRERGLVHPVEGALKPSTLVQGEVVALVVDELELVLRPAEGDVVVEERRAAGVGDHDDPSLSLEPFADRPGPGDGDLTTRSLPVPSGVEGPHPVSTEGDVDGGVEGFIEGLGEADALVVDARP